MEQVREKIEETTWAFLEGVASTLSKGEALDFEKVSKMLADQILAIPGIRIEDPDQELTKLRVENDKFRRLLVRYKAWDKETN